MTGVYNEHDGGIVAVFRLIFFFLFGTLISLLHSFACYKREGSVLALEAELGQPKHASKTDGT